MIPVLKLDDVGCNAAIPFKLRISAKSSRALSHWSACDKSRTDVFGFWLVDCHWKLFEETEFNKPFHLNILLNILS